MGRTAPMIDTAVLDEVIRYGFPELLYIARWENEDCLDAAIRERIPSIALVYRAALPAKLRSACAATIGPDIDQPPPDSHGQEIPF